MNREQMVALAGHLGIQVSDEMTDDDLAAAIISETENVVVPLTQARDSARRSRSLANDYPEEYERLQRLERTDRNHSAHTFAERYQNGLKDEKGEATTKGYSSLVLELIEGAHVAIAERTFTHENLAELLDACAVGVVDYGEQGSSRQQEKNLPRQDDSVRAKRDAFATAVREKMEQDNLEFDAAMKLVAEEQPELASMYLTAR